MVLDYPYHDSTRPAVVQSSRGQGVTSAQLNPGRVTSGPADVPKRFRKTRVLKSIALTPANPSIAPAATVQLVATATYDYRPVGGVDNVTEVVTGKVAFTSATPAKATISAGGLVTGVAAGTSVISAVLSGVTGTTTVTVTA